MSSSTERLTVLSKPAVTPASRSEAEAVDAGVCRDRGRGAGDRVREAGDISVEQIRQYDKIVLLAVHPRAGVAPRLQRI
jgi:hypothetical protein